jgi:hypothetical protein
MVGLRGVFSDVTDASECHCRVCGWKKRWVRRGVTCAEDGWVGIDWVD